MDKFKKFKKKADEVFSTGKWLLFQGLLIFCSVDDVVRFIWWVIPSLGRKM